MFESLIISSDSQDLLIGCSYFFWCFLHLSHLLSDAFELACLAGLVWISSKVLKSIEVKGANKEYIAAFIFNGHPMLSQDLAQISKSVR